MSVLEQIFLRYINFIDLLYTVQIHWRWAYKRKSRVSSSESSPFTLGAEWRGTSCFCSVCRKDVFFGQVAFQWSNNDNVGLYIVCTDRLASARRKTPRRRWSRPLLSVAWTTVSVTRCATASLTNWRAACSQFRTLPPGSWRAPGDAIIFRLCSASCCNGFLCGSVSCSRLRLLSTDPCPATPRITWLTTVSSSPTPVSDNCVLPTLEHSLSVGRAAVLETEPLPPQDRKSGTVCRPISDYVGCHATSSGGYWRHFYSDSEVTAQCELFLTAPNRNIIKYAYFLLTYLFLT